MSEQGGTKKPVLLVVDDNPDSVTILRSILETHGFAVRTAYSGAEALEQLEESLPDAVLLDVMMAGVSGLDVLQQIKSTYATSKIPVILVTGNTEDTDVLSGYQYGADYYVTKPFTSEQLLNGIRLLLGRVGSAEGGSGGGHEDVA